MQFPDSENVQPNPKIVQLLRRGNTISSSRTCADWATTLCSRLTSVKMVWERNGSHHVFDLEWPCYC